jgi:NAD(P)-dependent dehydrogenase (short-subunit alcohol dehydrogenase family)
MPTANSHLVVIGGTSGLGLEIAKAAHASGIEVTIGGRGAERAAEAAKSIGPDVTGMHIDLGDLASIGPALRDGPPIDHLAIAMVLVMPTMPPLTTEITQSRSPSRWCSVALSA